MNPVLLKPYLKDEKAFKEKCQRRCPFPWTDKQYAAKRYIYEYYFKLDEDSNGERSKTAILIKNNYHLNEDFIKKFYNYYYNSFIIALKKIFKYEYLDLSRNDIIDIKPLTYENKDYLNNSLLIKGSYIPFYAYKNKIKDKIVIGKHHHAYYILSHIKKEKVPYKYLCIFWDELNNQTFEEKIIIPRILNDTLLKEVNFKINKIIDKDFIEIVVNNAVDICLLLNVLSREAAFIIDYNESILDKLNILPPEGLMYVKK